MRILGKSYLLITLMAVAISSSACGMDPQREMEVRLLDLLALNDSYRVVETQEWNTYVGRIYEPAPSTDVPTRPEELLDSTAGLKIEHDRYSYRDEQHIGTMEKMHEGKQCFIGVWVKDAHPRYEEVESEWIVALYAGCSGA